MYEINEAAKVITDSIHPEAKVIFGAVQDERLKKGELKVTVIATGFSEIDPSLKAAEEEEAGFAPRTFADSPEKEDSNNNNNSSKKSSKDDSKDSDKDKDDEEDWDIPAFIRKKMK